jgi:phosphatidylglycerophosphate synthase
MFKTNVVALPLDDQADAAIATPWARIGRFLTYGRLPLGVMAALLVFTGWWRLAAVLVAVFVLIDVVDGRFARAGGLADSARRRATDALIDKLSVHACALGVCVYMPEALYLWVPLLARDLVQATVAGAALQTRRVVVAGAWWHRFFSLSMAIWGCGMLLTRTPVVALGLLALAVGALALVDYIRQCVQFGLLASPYSQHEA